MVAEPDPVPLRIVEVDGPAGAVDDEHAGRLETILPAAPLGGRDPERDEVEAGLPVAPRPRLGRLVGALEREELLAAGAEPEPDAPVAALVARPSAHDREPEHLAVEGLAAGEVGALDRDVVVAERHGRSVTPAARAANGQTPGPQAAAAPVIDSRRVPSPLAGKHLLLVAEDADLAALVQAALARLGARVQLVPSGRSALEALSRKAPDAAVVEVPLPDVRGSEVLSALGRAHVPAVVVSGVYRGPRAAAELRGLGACDFFEKPFAVDALARAVAQAIGAPGAPPDEEARDEVTGARPLSADEVQEGISASPVFALMDGPVAGAPAPRDGFSTPLPGGSSPRPVSPEVGSPPPRGDLATSSVPRLLVALHLGQATGALSLTRGPVKKIVVVDQGAPVYAASNVGGERLGAICVRRGIVAAERLEALRKEKPAARTADLLAAAGLLSPEKRAELVAGQLRGIAWSTFEWREGTYEFQLGKPPASRVPINIAMGDLVLEGMLRASTLPRLRAELPLDVHLAPSPDPAFELYALGLRAREARLLALADGTKSVADLARLSDLPERDALAFLQACRVMRVLDEAERVLASTRRIGFM